MESQKSNTSHHEFARSCCDSGFAGHYMSSGWRISLDDLCHIVKHDTILGRLRPSMAYVGTGSKMVLRKNCAFAQ